MDKQYDAEKVEKKWQEYWKKNKIYKFDPKSKKPAYSIDVPPPYASADHLHVGHTANYTQFDIVARYKKLRGFNVYLAPCFDNNGMPTERYVEKKYNLKKGDIPRSEFIKLCRSASKEAETNYSDRFFNALGFSYDWDLYYTTIDPEAQKIAQTVFLRFVKEGRAYRSEEPTFWCMNCQTALAQAEVESEPRDTKLNWIYFELDDGKKIEIATTRPEFLPATVAVFVHPEDKRYKKYIGKVIKVPLFDLKVPIMTDDAVDMQFGSGAMIVCDFGDSADVAKWKKYKLPLRIMLNKDGTLNEIAGKYKGLDLKTARESIIEDLNGQGFFIKDEPLHQEVGLCWRCQTPVEYLITKQWFINILNYKKDIIKFAKKINWYPKYMRNRLIEWTKNLGWDWCISRQRFYGVPIPVWYCKSCGNSAFPAETELPLDPTSVKFNGKCKCGSTQFEPEEDVFDTWMTSSNSPQIASKWLESPATYKKVCPMSLRSQSSNIIRTWAFYTIYKNLASFNSIPWKDVLISPFVLDPKGKGMSKSRGNAIWLHEILNKYSADAVRYWVSTTGQGGDIPFKEQDIVRGQKLLIKLWNTARFVSMQGITKSKAALKIEDKWILSRLAQVIKKYCDFFDKYEIGKARKELEMFFYNDFCDFYLEIVKHRLYGSDTKSKAAAQSTLHNSLLAIIQLWAPIMPHITEEIYQTLFNSKKSIHQTEIPKPVKMDKKSLELGDAACSIISEIRKWKQNKNMSLGAEVDTLEIQYPEPKKLDQISDVIKGTMRIKTLNVKKGKLGIK